MSLAMYLRETARQNRAGAAILDDDRTLTYPQFVDRVARGASLLESLGLKRGQRFATVMRNGSRQAELMFAGYWAGIVPVPVNWRLAPPEIAAIVADAECPLVMVDDDFLSVLDHPAMESWKGRHLVVDRPGGASDYDKRLEAVAPMAPQEIDENEDAQLIYTGGTTGRSKGVRLSHRNIAANAQQIAIRARILPDDIWLHVAPMFHAADTITTCGYLLGNAHHYVRVFTGQSALAAIERYRCTVTSITPTMIKMMLDEPDFGRYDLAHFRHFVFGASPMPVEWILALREKLPKALLSHCYGQSETAPLLCIHHHDDMLAGLDKGDLEPLKSAGAPLLGVEMRIVDDSMREVPRGQAGEVVVRGPNVMKGYLNRPDETAKAFEGGWLHTGDVGRLDERGRLYLFDRKKDMVITGGENVYTTEVEAAIYQHPAVAECAVFGVPDAKLNEALFAAIVVKPGAQLTVDEVIAHCRPLIGGYKIPRQMAFVESLPKSAVGKVLKTELRKTFRS